MRLPLKVSYWLACRIADVWHGVSTKDRLAVEGNISKVLGYAVPKRDVRTMARNVFRNFAKYLVDFFRFSTVDVSYVKTFVKIEGQDNLKRALSKNRGAVLLSAHIGNWELGGAVVSLIGYQTSAVVLTHQNRRINDFFKRQRLKVRMAPIEMGMNVRACYNALKANGVLALLGDRDFTQNGLVMDFFRDRVSIPKGPAVLSYRIGSPIVPTFLLREPDDTFRMVFEEPIYPDIAGSEDGEIISLTKKFVSVMEDYVKRYPTQWYVFQDIWSDNGKDLRPDTIV